MVRVYIDPGHGGTDPGAIGNELQEKDIVLDIGLKVREFLIGEYENVTVKMSRTTDKTVSLEERVEDANLWEANAFVSIHVNSFEGTADGYEDYIHSSLPDTSVAAQLQDILHTEIMKVNQLSDRGKKKADFHVLRETTMPAVLTENGFIDDHLDAKKMKQAEWIDAVARAHVKGIAQYFNLQKGDGNMKFRLKTGKFQYAEDLVKAKSDIAERFNWVLYEVPESLDWNPGYRIITGAAFNSLIEAEVAKVQLQKLIPGYAVYIIEA